MLMVEYFDNEHFTCLVFPFASGGNLYTKMKSKLVSERDIAIDLRLVAVIFVEIRSLIALPTNYQSLSDRSVNVN